MHHLKTDEGFFHELNLSEDEDFLNNQKDQLFWFSTPEDKLKLINYADNWCAFYWYWLANPNTSKSNYWEELQVI